MQGLRKFSIRSDVSRMIPPSTPTGEAFQLVRQLLSERPRHFREILRDGVALHPSSSKALEYSSVESAAAEGSSTGNDSTGVSRATTPVNARKGRKKSEVEAINVPVGHPFVSATFLKKKVLPVLESQNLIAKSWLPAFPGTQLAKLGGDKRHSMWSISNRGGQSEKLERHWSRITATTVSPKELSQLGYENKLGRQASDAIERERAFDAGEAERSEREVWAWTQRPEGQTTRLERTHLNVRRARGRTAKEARAGEQAQEREEILRDARETVKTELQNNV